MQPEDTDLSLSTRAHRTLRSRVSLLAALTAVAFASATSCTARAPAGTENDEAVDETAQAIDAPICVTIQRGATGDVADTYIVSNQPAASNGAKTSVIVSGAASSTRQYLLRFDLASIPRGAIVTSAQASLNGYQYTMSSSSLLRAHEVLSPWDEATATWSSFGGAYDAAVEASSTCTSYGHASALPFDVKSAAQGWVNDATTNRGLLIETAATVQTGIATSEASSAATRPKLDICYLQPTCTDGVQNGDETGVDCGGACAAPEVCDGKDNDCNGQVDDGLGTVSCGLGLCKVTVAACQGGQPASCAPSPAAPEICDGNDNDCDGQVDEDFGLGDACAVGTGACARGGKVICRDGGHGATCSATAGAPSAEICDGTDNDCNGQVDEGFAVGASCTAGVGACARAGKVICDGSGAATCDATAGTPAPEVCDGIDNDCDGQADEDFGLGSECTVGVGACARTGSRVCSQGGATCGATPAAPSAELCNGIDDDCDGQVDEGVKSVFYRDADGDGHGDPHDPEQACQAPAGYVADATDCNDATASDEPGATELCDGRDNDCDGDIDEAFGLGSICTVGLGACASAGSVVCDAAGGTMCNATAGIPGTEVCDGVDNDCDGFTDEFLTSTFYRDEDGDGYGDPANATQACAAPAGYVDNSADCSDTSRQLAPGVTETCDGVDQNCDGKTDEGFGVGSGCSAGVGACARTGKIVCNASGEAACDATPGTPSLEVFDGIDNDCDGQVDEGVGFTFYRDADGDGYGDPNQTAMGGAAPPGYVDNALDCDDTSASSKPGAAERCDAKDNNCNGQTDEGLGLGTLCNVGVGACARTGSVVCDGQGNAVCGATAGSPSVESCDGADNDCDGLTDEGVKSTFYRDADGDGYGDAGAATDACAAPTGYVANAADCDDMHASSKPGGAEVCDGLDNDCNGQTDDGLGLGTLCSVGVGACARVGGVVCDGAGSVTCSATAGSPSAEVCDGADNDCDGLTDEGVTGTFYRDADGDGYGTSATTTQACTAPAGYVSNASDCDDGDASRKPGATEQCNGADDDCNGATDEGFGLGGSCSVGTGACVRTGSVVCNGLSSTKCSATAGSPSTEVCNGVDDNCNGSTDEGVKSTFYRDADGDGYGNLNVTTQACSAPGGYVTNASDCNDGTSSIRPGAAELCDGVDNNCNYVADEGYGLGDDCSAGTGACERSGSVICNGPSSTRCSATAGSPSAERCDGVDNNCNGSTDEGFGLGGACAVGTGACYRTGSVVCNGSGSSTCSATAGSPSTEICDGVDNNCDGSIDEGLVGLVFCDSPGKGMCKPGLVTCIAGSLVCKGILEPQSESCNGSDDDCDGQTDEGFGLGASCAVGVGACYRTGSVVCSGSGGTTCSASPGSPSAEVCGNGVDDNCNGQVDEQCTAGNGASCSSNAQCASGFCVSGICCDSACNYACNRCDGVNTGDPPGTCAPVFDGYTDNRCGNGKYCCMGACQPNKLTCD